MRWLDETTLTLHVNQRETGLRPIFEEIGRIAGRIQITGREELVRGTRPPGDTGLPFGVRVGSLN